MGKYKSIFLESFVGTSGALGALAVSLLIGMAFGIPGLILVAREQKKAKGDQNMALLVFGFILMISQPNSSEIFLRLCIPASVIGKLSSTVTKRGFISMTSLIMCV